MILKRDGRNVLRIKGEISHLKPKSMNPRHFLRYQPNIEEKLYSHRPVGWTRKVGLLWKDMVITQRCVWHGL